MSLQIELNRLNSNATGAWLQGPRITFENVSRGTGPVERIPAGEVFNGSRPAQSTTAAQPPPALHVMPFGKHKGRPMAIVQDEDPSYWSWAIRECNGFEAKARKAGLLDDEL